MGVLTGFSRLSGMFRSGINFSNYASMTENAARQMTGNLPKDLLSVLIKGNPTRKGESIKNIQTIFEETAGVLKGIDKLETQAINRTPATFSSLERIWGKRSVFFWKNDPLYAERELEAVIRAEEVLLKGLKKELPELKNIIISPLGSGNFGLTYRCKFLGGNGSEIISDKVIKIYREKGVCDKIGEVAISFMRRIVNGPELEKSLKTRLKKAKDPDKIKEINKLLNKLPALRRLLNRSIDKLTKTKNDMSAEHGAAAEANIAEYIKFFSGHKISPEDGIVIPDMFGLGKTKFALSEFIGKNRKATKEFSFKRLGVEHNDFKCNPGNGINGICIDLGGVSPISSKIGSELIGNKNRLRVIKNLYENGSVKSNDEISKILHDAFTNQKISKELKNNIETIFQS